MGVVVGWGWWWGFRVSEVSAQVEPPGYVGPCPATLKFVARITVKGGPGVVRYNLPREGFVVEGSIRFESSGTKEVTSDVTLGRIPDASGTLQIDILKPRIQRVKAAYRIRCTSWSGP